MRPALYNLRAFQLASLIARLLPRRCARALGIAVARSAYRRNASVQSALRQNLSIATGATGLDLEILCQSNVEHFGAMLADYFRCATGRRPEEVLGQWQGIEHIQHAMNERRGVILVTAHLGHWELGGLLLARRGLPVRVVTLEEPESSLTRWRDEHRQTAGVHTITVGPGHAFGFVEIVQALRRNELVAMLVDRPYAGSGISVQFFQRMAEFSSGPALLWQHTRAAVIPAFVLGDASGRYTAVAHAPLEFTRGADPQEDLTRNSQILASHFENVIRQHVEQWFNYVPIWPDADPVLASPLRSAALRAGG